MHDVEGLATLARRLVRSVKTLKGAVKDRHGDAERKVLVPPCDLPQNASERFAVDVLDHQEQLAVVRDDIERARDVRMADPGCEPRFVEEHGRKLRILR